MVLSNLERFVIWVIYSGQSLKVCPKPKILAFFSHKLKKLADQIRLRQQPITGRLHAFLPKWQVWLGQGVLAEVVPAQVELAQAGGRLKPV